jgi:hypothetical protein
MGRRIAWCLCAAACVAGAVHAQSGQSYYRWKDASGATHYSDTPPPGGKANRVTVDERTPATPSATAALPAGASSTGLGSNTAALDRAEAAAVERNCSKAKGNLATLQGSAMIVDGADLTKARRMSPDELTAARASAEADVRTYCGAAK